MTLIAVLILLSIWGILNFQVAKELKNNHVPINPKKVDLSVNNELNKLHFNINKMKHTLRR